MHFGRVQRLCDIKIADLARFPIDHKTLLLKTFDECSWSSRSVLWNAFLVLFFWSEFWVSGCCRETRFFTFIPGRTLIIISDAWYQDNPQTCWECVSPGSKNTDAVRTAEGLVTAPASLPFLWERKTEAAIYILFSMAAELWTRSLFASSNKFKCNQVLFKGRHSSREQACVHMCCALHIFGCTAVDCPAVAQAACFQTAPGLYVTVPLMQRHQDRWSDGGCC